MNKRLQILILLSLSGLVLASPVIAQDNEPTLPSATEAGETVPEEEIPAAQEVEITEDNYRQFMELKDAMRQRNVIPENVFKPGSGLQKLDKLPEESQKHLRNQLREIIVQGDPWQPGDEEAEYPYTPSPAASTNPALEKQEMEAWGELVDSYHDRESQIYENSSGMQAARGSEQGSSNSRQNGTGSNERQGQNVEGSEGQQAGQQGNPNQADTEGTYSLNGSADSSANSTAGVSQNAMEFLKGSTGQTGGLAESGTVQNGGSGESDTPPSEGDKGQGESDGGEQVETQAMAQEPGAQGSGQEGEQADRQDGEQANDGQISESSERSMSTAQPDSIMLGSPTQPEKESTAGASQNALEYLTGEDPGAIDGDINEDGEEQAEGTLSIEDLLNAQGVGNSSEIEPATDPDKIKQHPEIKADKDDND